MIQKGTDPNCIILEAEVEVFSLDVGVLLWGFCFQMDRIAFNVNGFDGADEFAASATYAEIGGGFRDG